ncbi:MAG: ATP-binding protein [Rectinemataceae bacterium]|nr:ATP-binding protein [Rectinemataceae bacterium]
MAIIERRFFRDISKLSEEKAILILHGARQTGKSTALRWWVEGEKVKGRDTLYIDLEDPAVLSVCESGVAEFLRYATATGHDTSRLSVALDEVQYLSDPSKFLKLLFDGYGDDIRIAASGSSSFAIKSKFKESLVGRTIPIEVFGLDFSEYCRFIGEDRNFSVDWPEALDSATSPLFRDFTETGAYPGLVATTDRSVKARRIRQIIQTYIQSDVRELGRVRYPDRFEALLRMLADQAGSLVNVVELGASLKMARATVEEYLFLLEQTYVVRRIRPFAGSVRTELTKMPKLYFEDNGVLAMERHFEFGPLDGSLFENAVFGELRKRFGVERLKFWRTTTGNEVDFILDEGEAAIELKLRPRASDCANLLRFGQHYGTKKLVLCGMERPSSLPEGVEFAFPWHLADALS